MSCGGTRIPGSGRVSATPGHVRNTTRPATMRAALLLLALVAAASAHLCLLSPVQRAPANNFNTVGAPDCAIITGPCGCTPATVIARRTRSHSSSLCSG